MSPKPEQSSSIIRMVGQLVQSYPHLMVEHASRLKECLDYFSFLHPTAASSLIQKICPLFSLRSDLQGYAVLVLRKAMFGRETSSRMTALHGFLSLLTAEADLKLQNDTESLMNSSSEASCSQQGLTCTRKGSSLLQELMGLFRRCLVQQADIRESLYRGLLKLVLIEPATAEHFFNLLWPHFSKYYRTHEDSQIVLNIDITIKLQNGVAIVEEPLDELIFCAYILLTLQPHREDGQSLFTETCFDFSLSQDLEFGQMHAAESLRDAFLDISKSLQQSSLTGLKLDKSQEFSPDTNEGKINIKKIQLYLGIFEVLINSTVSQMVGSEDLFNVEKELCAYISLYDDLEQLLRQVSSSGSMKLRPLDSVNHRNSSGKLCSGSTILTERGAPFISASNTAYLLQYLQNTNHQGMPQNSNAALGSSDQESSHKVTMNFKHKVAALAIRSCLRHVKVANCDLLDSENPVYGAKQLFGDWKTLGKPILEVLKIAVNMNSGILPRSVDKEKEKEKQSQGKKNAEGKKIEGLVLTLVKCLDELSRLAYKKNCLVEVFEGLGPALPHDRHNLNVGGESVQEEWLIEVLLFENIQPLLEHLLQRSQFREFEVLCDLLLGLGRKLQASKMKMLGSWAELKCKTMHLTLNAGIKALIKLSICMSTPPDDVILALDFTKELLKVMGTEEEDCIEISAVYCVLNSATRNAVAGLLLQYVEANLSDLEWLVSKLKLQPTTRKINDFLEDTQLQVHDEAGRLKTEIALHTRLEALVNILAQFVQMSLNGALATQFLRVAVKLYKCLAATSRVCIAPKGFKQAIPSVRFQSLVEVTCKTLTAPLYNFMAIMQREQQENCQAKGSVNKIKREVRMIPNLIFHVEDYERYLIQLGKLTQVNLLKHAKRSTARDFRILENGKKCKVPHPERSREEESGGEDGEGEAGEDGEAGDVEQGEEQGGNASSRSQSDNENSQEQNVAPPRFRRPMEKRRKQAVVQEDSDEEV